MSVENPKVSRCFIDLQKGWPSPRLLPSQALRLAASEVLADTTRSTDAMLYGPNMGGPALRESVAAWLSQLYRLRSPPAVESSSSQDHGTGARAPPISSDRICITNGASGNLAAIMDAFTDPCYTRRVWMVEPTYFLACTIFDDAGFQGRLVGIPEDEEGPDMGSLRARIEQVDRKAEAADSTSSTAFKQAPQYCKLYRHVIYLVPTFSNPSAKTYTVARREALVQLARAVDALIITDDCYDFLSWTAHDAPRVSSAAPPPPPRLVDIDTSLPGGNREWGNTVSNGSFSKLVGPGLRCGWAEATPAFIRRLNMV